VQRRGFIGRLAAASVIGLLAKQASATDPTVIQSESEEGHFSVTLKDMTPGTYTVTLPEGMYSGARTFIAPTGGTVSQAYVNLWCKNPNEAAPVEAGLQLVNRFENGPFSADRWAEHQVTLPVGSGGRLVKIQVGCVGSDSPTCAYIVKLFGYLEP
jgi:hypothetical protein